MPRLVALARAGLAAIGITNASRHVLVVDQTIRSLLLVKREPFTVGETASVREYAAAAGWKIQHDPVAPSGKTPYDVFLAAPDPRPLERQASVALHPPRDDSPFFFQMTRWRDVNLRSLRQFTGRNFLEPLAIPVAQIALASAPGLSLLLSLALLAVPLAGRSVPRQRRGMWLFYFLCLGVAYIVVEVVLMQRFALFLGHPTYSVTAVLFGILLFSGLGAAWSDRRTGTTAQVARPVLVGLPIAILLLAFAVPPALDRLMGLPHVLRVAIAITIIGPVAFLMGVPFPLGIRAIAASGGRHIPWAWAANGCASVVGSVCAVLGAMLWSFSAMLVLAGFVYVLATLTISRARIAVA
jgi:hypothetical protein